MRPAGALKALRASRTSCGVKPRHLLVLTYWRFEDALVQTYTLPYVRILLEMMPAGSTIRLVTLERGGDAGSTRVLSAGLFHMPLRFFAFGSRAAAEWAKNIARLTGTIVRHRIDGIHAWCTPPGAIGLVLSRITGVPLVIDSYEPHAEAMLEGGVWKRSGPAFQLLFALERAMSHHASALIAAAPAMQAYAEEKYGLRRGPLPVKPACVDLELFRPGRSREDLRQALGLVGKVVCVYAGKFGGIYLEEEVFTLFAAAYAHWGDSFRALLLTSHSPETLLDWATRAGLPHECLVVRFVPHAEVPDYLGLGDFALTPVKPAPSKRACTPIKDGEYWALGLPVLITPGISEDSDLIAAHECGIVWREFSAAGSRAAICEMDLLLQGDRDALRAKNRQLAETHRNFDIARRIYRSLYAS